MVIRSLPIFVGVFALAAAPLSYKDSMQQWRRATEASLKADDGWLTVSGLFWLNEGTNKAGQGEDNVVQLPEGSPKVFGVFQRSASTITFRPAPNIRARHNGVPASAQVQMNYGAKPDLLTFQDLTLFVIKRGDQFAIRLRDRKSKMRRDFKGLHWYPVQETYRVEAKWMAYKNPRMIAIPNVLNRVDQQQSLGFAVFKLHGKEYTLEPVVEGQQLFYIFKDLTAGKETYPAGRFLYSEAPVNGKVILDFNKAYNPPCAFTPYATCPLPPQQNRLQTRVEAGELTYLH